MRSGDIILGEVTMTLFTAYVAGPVHRPKHDGSFPIDSLYTELESTAKAHSVQLTLPKYSDRFDGLPARSFAKEIRDLICKADAMIAVIVRPTGPYELSGYSIAVEAHEAALAQKPIALLAENENLALPRLLAALDGVQKYAFAGPKSLNLMFEGLAKEIKLRKHRAAGR
jgi:hypothetical protein